MRKTKSPFDEIFRDQWDYVTMGFCVECGESLYSLQHIREHAQTHKIVCPNFFLLKQPSAATMSMQELMDHLEGHLKPQKP